MANIRQQTHIEEETLERYALGKLREEEAAPLEEHLFICHKCQDRLAETDDYIRAFRAAAPKLAADRPRESWFARFRRVPNFVWIPALAAAAVVGIVIQTPSTYDRTQTVELRSMRGAETSVTIESGSLLDLRLGSEGLESRRPYRVEIADAKGTKVWYGVVSWQNDVATIHVPKLLVRGQYWVRLFEIPPDSEIVREYGLIVR